MLPAVGMPRWRRRQMGTCGDGGSSEPLREAGTGGPSQGRVAEDGCRLPLPWQGLLSIAAQAAVPGPPHGLRPESALPVPDRHLRHPVHEPDSASGVLPRGELEWAEGMQL
eukprot:4695559-Alexandrium_andersonii.AAC.1